MTVVKIDPLGLGFRVERCGVAGFTVLGFRDQR